MSTSVVAVPNALPDLKEAKKALSIARIGMMGSGSAFITSVCFSLKQEFTDEIPRAGTDGLVIYYNPAYFLSILPAERIGLVVHETWHVALNHCKLQKYSRMGERHPKLWNVSADAIINNYIIDSGMKLPPDRIDMPEMRGKSTEQVYEILMDRFQLGEPTPVLPTGWEDILEPAQEDEPGDAGTTGTGKDPGEMSNKMKQILVKAAMVSKMAGEDIGSLPGDIQFHLQQIVNPKLPWTRLVQRYFTTSAKTLYNFQKPNRRYYPQHYMPTRSGKTLANVIGAIDMSSSVNDREVTQFVAEIAQVLRSVMPKIFNLVEFDTQITQVTRMHSAQQLVRHKFKGRGGTNITPVMQYANDHPADLVIVFTDGGFRPSKVTPTSPVLWVIYNNPYFTCPYGTIIHVDI